MHLAFMIMHRAKTKFSIAADVCKLNFAPCSKRSSEKSHPKKRSFSSLLC
jgi:hypothetical protein